MDAIKKRRSVRDYAPTPIPEDVLERVVEAGRIAPSAMNYQPWHFVIATDPKVRMALSDGRYAKFLRDCPVVIVGCGDKKRSPEWYAVDVTIALQNMVTQATAEGLGTCWIGSFFENKVKEALEVPEDYAVVAMLAVGYPKGRQNGVRKVKDAEDVTSRNRFAKG